MLQHESAPHGGRGGGYTHGVATQRGWLHRARREWLYTERTDGSRGLLLLMERRPRQAIVTGGGAAPPPPPKIMPW